MNSRIVHACIEFLAWGGGVLLVLPIVNVWGFATCKGSGIGMAWGGYERAITLPLFKNWRKL